MLPSQPYRVFVGFDANEMRACNVAIQSMLRQCGHRDVHYERICRLSLLKHYDRPTTLMPNGQLFDEISGAPMSTDHAIARFFVPFLCGYQGWALFTDGDVLFREDVRQLFAMADERCALQVVQHRPLLQEGEKKTGHIQQAYPRKNWSSVMLFNCGHPANRTLTVDVLNAWPGRDLHAFGWLMDDVIGVLLPRWNYLCGLSPAQVDPAIVHFTLGTPDVAGHEHDPFADEWFAQARMAGYRFDKEGVLRGTATRS